jgi:hypothetical protein
MDKAEEQILRAEQALQVLNNPLFELAFKETRQGILEAWARLDSGDERKREYSQDLHRMVRALDRVEKCLKEHITTGKLARADIEGKRNLLGRAKF